VALLIVYFFLFVAFFVMFSRHLKDLSDVIPDRCYNPHYISSFNVTHPEVDHIYLYCSVAYIFITAINPFALPWLNFLRPNLEACCIFPKFTIISVVVQQVLVHLYFMITL